MTRTSIARHVDILAVGAVLVCYAGFVAGESGMAHWRTLVQQKRSTIQRFEHRRVSPVGTYLEARKWLRRA